MMLTQVASVATITGGFSVLIAAASWAGRKWFAVLEIIEFRTQELEHNGGGSIKDSVRRLEEASGAQEKTLKNVNDLLFETRAEAISSRARIAVDVKENATRLAQLQQDLTATAMKADFAFDEIHKTAEVTRSDTVIWRAGIAHNPMSVLENGVSDGTVSEGDVEP